MAIKYSGDKTTVAAHTRILVAVICGLVASVVSSRLVGGKFVPLVGWDVAVLVYLAWMWVTVWQLDDKLTADFALREDPSRGIADFILLFASIASLAAVGFVLVSAKQGNQAHAVYSVALGVISVLLAWALTHTIFMLRYAELYYKNPDHAVEFDGSNKKPSYTDFAYLAFTMGMTFQVSDTGFQSTEFRSMALRHALLSYLFGTIIVATTINLVAGLIG